METRNSPSELHADSPIVERLKALPGKLRSRGPGWLLKRIWNEIFVPTTSATEAVRDKLAAVRGRLRSPRGFDSADLLPAFYDLEVNPITFDFAWFLVGAEIAARRAGKSGFLLVVVPGTQDGLREEMGEYERFIDASNRRWRLNNVVLPLARMCAWCRGMVICADRSQADFYVGQSATDRYPPRYQTLFPRCFEYSDFFTVADRPGCFEGLKASEQGRRHVQQWIAKHVPGRRVVTATLRNYPFQPSRNSNMPAWSELLRGLDRTLYAPVIVPDTDSAFEPLADLSGLPTFGEAPWNLELRMALYELAYANLFVNNGPASLAQLNPACRYLCTKIVVPDVRTATEEFQRRRGLIPGQPPRFATPTQVWWWHDDTLENLRDGFRLLQERIEAIDNVAQ